MRYEVLGPLGQGGMGVVYQARDTRLGRLVALKVLASDEASEPARDRSMIEALAIAALNHPNIATIYEIIERDGAATMVLEYLPGGTLRSRIDVCREPRRVGFTAPIIMVTGRVSEVDRVVGLEIGADDSLTKPFGQRELVARIRVHLRRTAHAGL